jgi:cell division protease FtsH
VTEGENTAREVIGASRRELEAITQALMEFETISGDEVQAVMRGDKITRKPDDDVPRDQAGSAVPSAGGRFRPTGGTGPMEPQPQS